MNEDPDVVRRAAELLRENGYAVVTRATAEHWDRWITESHDRERQHQDEIVRLNHEINLLEFRCADLLDGRRPAWWRAYRQRRYGSGRIHGEPVVGPEPAAQREVAS